MSTEEMKDQVEADETLNEQEGQPKLDKLNEVGPRHELSDDELDQLSGGPWSPCSY